MAKMNWKEKVLAGMELIAQGCEEKNGEWGFCNQCPFTNYCNSIWKDNNVLTPQDLFKEVLEKGLDNN